MHAEIAKALVRVTTEEFNFDNKVPQDKMIARCATTVAREAGSSDSPLGGAMCPAWDARALL